MSVDMHIGLQPCRPRYRRLVAKRQTSEHELQLAKGQDDRAINNWRGEHELQVATAWHHWRTRQVDSCLLPARLTLHRTQIVVGEGPLALDRRGAAEPGDGAAVLRDRHGRLPDPLHV